MPTLKEQAYSQLLDQILSGGLVPGQLLNRRGTAERLGMSAAPVHEAMLRLEQDGFLEALPRLGTRVRTASREDVRGHLVVREALECQAARMVCGEGIRREREPLAELALAADSCEASDEERARREVAFHVALVERAECPALSDEYRRVMRVGLFYRVNLLMTMPSRQPASRHLDLLDELGEAAPAAAEELVRRHIWTGKPDMLKT